MIITPFAPGHLRGFAWQGKQADMAPYMSAEVITWAITDGLAWTGLTPQGKVIGCAGVAPWSENVGVAWAVFSDLIAAYALPATRAATRGLALAPYPRIEAMVAVDHPKAADWAKALGFRREGRVQNPAIPRAIDLYVRVR